MPLPATIARQLAYRQLIIFRNAASGRSPPRLENTETGFLARSLHYSMAGSNNVGRVIRDEESPLV